MAVKEPSCRSARNGAHDGTDRNARMAARDASQPKEARTMNEQNNTDALERIVDLHGLRSTLDMLANICAEKAKQATRDAIERSMLREPGCVKDVPWPRGE